MAFESLSDKLQNIFKNLRGKGRLSEADVKAALKEVKMALLEADVSFKVVKPNCFCFIGSAFSIYLNISGEKLGNPRK